MEVPIKFEGVRGKEAISCLFKIWVRIFPNLGVPETKNSAKSIFFGDNSSAAVKLVAIKPAQIKVSLVVPLRCKFFQQIAKINVSIYRLCTSRIIHPITF
jgi:hypothetical protein